MNLETLHKGHESKSQTDAYSVRQMLVQTVGRILLVLPLAGGIAGYNSQATQISAAKESSSTSLAIWLANSILEKLAEEQDAAKREEISQNLAALEGALDQSHASLKSKVAQLKTESGNRVDANTIRSTINEVLMELQQDIGKLRTDFDKLENMEGQTIELFGYLPTAAPSPLLIDDVEGNVHAHPLTVEWAELLCESETQRIATEKLSKIYYENAPEIQQANEKMDSIKKRTSKFHLKTEIELSKKLLERVELLKTRKPTHPSVKEFDKTIASLTWLAVVSRPQKEGRNEGTMEVNADFVGPAGSDIVAAFELSGHDIKAIVPLYRHAIPLMPMQKGVQNQELAQLKHLEQKYEEFVTSAAGVYQRVDAVSQNMRTSQKEKSDINPELRELLKTKAELVKNIHWINEQADTLLNECIAGYIETMKTDRTNSDSMERFVLTVLRPLQDIHQHSNCMDWANSVATNETFMKYSRLYDNCARKYGQLYTTKNGELDLITPYHISDDEEEQYYKDKNPEAGDEFFMWVHEETRGGQLVTEGGWLTGRKTFRTSTSYFVYSYIVVRDDVSKFNYQQHYCVHSRELRWVWEPFKSADPSEKLQKPWHEDV